VTGGSTLASSRENAILFDLEAVGGSFQEVAVDVVRGENTEFMSRWFKASRGDADLSVWVDGERRIVKHQLSIFGQVVEWTPIYGTRTGLIIETESDAETIQFDKKAERVSVEQAISLLTHVTALSETERSTLIYNLRESPKLHKRARERAIKAWAPQSEEIISNVRPSFWNKLGKWVFGK
jgi:hypothetical protein